MDAQTTMFDALCPGPAIPDQEIWKPVKDYPRYEVSSLGRVRTVNSLQIAKMWDNGSGYNSVKLTNDYGRRWRAVHRLVAEAFLTKATPQCIYVNHINSIRNDNRAVNLEWVTPSQNNKHAFRNPDYNPNLHQSQKPFLVSP